MKFTCPTCKSSRHVAEVGSGEIIETTGESPSVDSCWYCGTPVPYTDEEIADMEQARDE